MSHHNGLTMNLTLSSNVQTVTAEKLLDKAHNVSADLGAFEQDIISLNTELTYRLGTSRVASVLKTMGLTYVGHFQTLIQIKDQINGLISQASQLDGIVDVQIQELDLALQKLLQLEEAVYETYLQGVGKLADEVQREEDDDFAAAFRRLALNKEGGTEVGLGNLMDALGKLGIRPGTGRDE
jgi:hypothetical protein